MRKYRLAIVVLLIALVALSLLASCSSNATTQIPASSGNVAAGIPFFQNQQEGIWVNGSGKVTVAPDIMNISLGVQDQEPTIGAAQANTTQAMNAIMNVLKSNNIANQDIQTQQLSITPVYQAPEPNSNKPSVIVGYEITNIVNVKIRNISGAGAIIDAITAAGGDLTRINNISFSVDNPNQYYDQARQLAMDDANAKATQLANLAKVKLGIPTYISENSNNPVPYFESAAGRAAAAPVPISAGSTDIIINVQVVYTIMK